MSTVSLAAARASIKTILDGVIVPATGHPLATDAKTHDYFRHIVTVDARDSLLVKGGVLHAWMVSHGDTDVLVKNIYGIQQEQSTSGWVLYGYYGVNDEAASEKTWDDIVEAVVKAFRDTPKLGNTVINAEPVNWKQGGYVLMPPGEGGVFCHRAVITIPVKAQTFPY